MVNRRIIEYIINKSIQTVKCGVTVGEMHTLLGGWSQNEKDKLIHYALPSNGNELEFYHNLLKSGNEDDIFEYERQIFDILSKTQRDNILEYLTDINLDDYKYDEDVGYPNKQRGELEAKQEQIQENQGYSEDEQNAMIDWTHGYYEDIQEYALNGVDEDLGFKDGRTAKKDFNIISNFIENSQGLDVDTILYRGGHWDIGMKQGEIGTMPILSATSYSYDTAYELGIEMEDDNPNRYMITVYAPKGTKGAMIDAPSLSPTFPEHEYLLNKNQRYIVVDVNDEDKTASILLIND